MSITENNGNTDSVKQVTSREKLYAFGILGIVLLCLILIALHPFVKTEGDNLTSFGVNANIGWKYEDGSDADLTSLRFSGGKGVIKRDITSVFTAGKDLCFETSNLLFRVYLNNEQIYDFYPEISFYYGKYYGDYFHFINIPYFKGTGHLRIEYEALVENDWTSFRNALMTEGNEYLKDGVGSGIFEFALCFTSIILGLIIIVLGLVFRSRSKGLVETLSLGALAVIVACYLMSGTHIWQLLFMDCTMPRLAEYVALSLVPIPLILFVASYTNRLDTKLTLLICVSSLTLFALIFVTMFTGIFDYSALLLSIHVNILISMIVLIFFLFANSRSKEAGNIRSKWLVIAFIVLIITGVIDVTLYYIQKSQYEVRTINYGLAVFIIILTIHEIKNIMEINRKNSEAETMYRLARVDGLTGLANRLSFDEAEKELSDDNDACASFVLLDINYLKTVNDMYGHSEGDRHIRSAARIIEESFADYGPSFRIGGDEFFAIVKGEQHELRTAEAIKKMMDAINRYNQEENPPIPLNIACGVASYEAGINSVGEAEKLADSRMYKNKKRMKESLA